MENNSNNTFMLFSTNSKMACDNVSFIAEIPQGIEFEDVENVVRHLSKYTCFTVSPIGAPDSPALLLPEFYEKIKNIKLHHTVMRFVRSTFEEVNLPDGVAINQSDTGVPIIELMTSFSNGSMELVDKEIDLLKALKKLFEGELVYNKTRAQFRLIGKATTVGNKQYITSYGIVGCSLVKKTSYYAEELEEL